MTTIWKEFKFIDLITISSKKIADFDGEKEYIATGDIDGDRIVSSQIVTYSNKPSRADLLLGQRDVLFAKMKGTVKVLVGKKEYEDKIFSTGFYIVTPKENVSLDFLYFFLISKEFNLQKDLYCTGATMSAITNEGLKKIKIKIPVNKSGEPDLKEQERISVVFKETEDLKNKRLEANKKMEELITALFIKMFGDPIDNIKKWRTVPAHTFLKIQSGFAFKSSDFAKVGIPIIKIGTINKGYFDKNSLCFLPMDYLDLYRDFIISPGDLLITLTGTAGKDDYGNVSIMGNEFNKYLLNQRVAKLDFDCSQINKSFLFVLLGHKKIKNLLIKNNRGVRQGNINNQDLLNLSVILPPIELQNRFAELVQKIEVQKEKQKESTQKIDTLFNAVMAQAFN